MKFDKDFIFGGATAAYQCEGAINEDGKGVVCWDKYLEETNGYNPEPASDFYNMYKEDLENCEKFGINGIRISIAWTRIFPNGDGQVNKKGVEHYHNLFRECIKRGVEPLVTLHHFDTPYELNKNGDFTNKATVDLFVRYAKFCLKEFNEVQKWATFNEIWPWSSCQYLIGTFPPAIKYDLEKTVKCIHNMLLAHAMVVNYFKDTEIPGEIGIVHSLQTKYPIDDDPKNIDAAKREDAITNGMALDATYLGYYSPETMKYLNKIFDGNGLSLSFDEEDFEIMKKAAGRCDFLGINYYSSQWLRAYDGENDTFHNGTGERGTAKRKLKAIAEEVQRDDLPKTDWDWIIYPQGLYDMIMRIVNDYPNYNKIYITENGIGIKEELNENNTVEDTQRIDYVRDHLKVVLKAIEHGANIKGYYLWSLMDMFSWSNGYNKRYGFFFVDFDTMKRYPKRSAYWWKELSQTKELI
ncbi:MAG: 6-phospho-beta-galactosidase [Tissierellia bacterium]|nr:6-phospho-beta-galactosidase [Tissierellia bacterium]